MKKIILSFMMLFALLMVANAQTLLNEGFENGLPSTWTTIDNDGNGYNWCAEGFIGHSGETCISSASGWSYALMQNLTPDNWLITPQINLTGNAILRFFVSAQNSYFYEEHYSVLISTTGNAVSDFTDTLLEETFSGPLATNEEPSPYVGKSIDLSIYTGQQVYIAFRHHTVTRENYLNLDDVSIMLIPTTPTIFATEPSYDFGVNLKGDTATWSTTIDNYNLTQDVTATVSSPFVVSADGLTYGQTTTIPAAGGTLYVKFTPTLNANYMNDIQLTSAGAPDASIAVEGRGIDCDSLTLPYFSTFTSKGMYCWQIVDANNDGITFENYGGYVTYWADFMSGISADDYLISPQFDFNGGVYLTLDYSAFEACVGDFEKFEVLAIGADTIRLTEEIIVEDIATVTLLLDLDNLVGRYSIALHCISDAGMYALDLSNFGIYEYENGRVIVNQDSLDFSLVSLGQDKVLPVMITNLGVTDTVIYNATAPFQVSLDNVNFASQVVRPTPASNLEYDTLYVKFAPTAVGVFNDFVTVTYLSNVDTIRVKGEGVDSSATITEFPFEYDFKIGIYPNPASNIININASENMQKIQVLNMAGQCVYSSQVGGNNTQVNVSNMADGLYFVKVYTDNGNVSTKKIVVRK